jgi:hypothetical protein
MAQLDSDTKSKVDRPTPFVVYFISMIIGLMVFIPGFTGLVYLLKINQYFDGKGVEFNVALGLILGLVVTVAFGLAFGYFANKQIIDMKD